MFSVADHSENGGEDNRPHGCSVLRTTAKMALLLKRATWPYELDFLHKQVTRKKAASSNDGWNAESCAESADSYYQ
ncbi:hypothetical protein M514_20467 [Trichuris suis]|uniref:Uncharacterized protein n=1 Tax=Trichuris suis TaxID=68888 RepID=A0A085ND85_9BILA|nr:hypothetical protein M514_20467 [Trichuris suis]